MVDNYTTESYSQAFDGTRIQLYDDVEGSFMEEFDIGNINTDILKNTLAAESKTLPLPPCFLLKSSIDLSFGFSASSRRSEPPKNCFSAFVSQ